MKTEELSRSEMIRRVLQNGHSNSSNAEVAEYVKKQFGATIQPGSLAALVYQARKTLDKKPSKRQSKKDRVDGARVKESATKEPMKLSITIPHEGALIKLMDKKDRVVGGVALTQTGLVFQRPNQKKKHVGKEISFQRLGMLFDSGLIS